MDLRVWMTCLALTINNFRSETSQNLIRTASVVDGVIYPWVEREASQRSPGRSVTWLTQAGNSTYPHIEGS